MRARTCEKRITGKQPLRTFSTRRNFARGATFSVRLKKISTLLLHNFGGKCRFACKIPPSGKQALDLGSLGSESIQVRTCSASGWHFRCCDIKDTRKVKVLSLPETIKEKSTFRAKALRRKLKRRAFARNVDFFFIVSGSERTFTFRVSLNTLPTLATLVYDIKVLLWVKTTLGWLRIWSNHSRNRTYDLRNASLRS